MKWTTSNLKKADYESNHVIYIGSQTGSFKRLTVASKDDPFAQYNLHKIEELDRDSRITALSYINTDKSEILIGRAKSFVQLHCCNKDEIKDIFKFDSAPVVGLGYFNGNIIASIANGRIQCTSYNKSEGSDSPRDITKVGDNVDHMRQFRKDLRYIATGGKGRQNNLKVIDLASDGQIIHSSKNLPNDNLQLEVPVWDSDIEFLEMYCTVATCSRYGYVRAYDFRAQRRPVQRYYSDEKFSFSTIATIGNSIGVGTTMGSILLFDIRRMKTFVHKYKGFTGGISNIRFDTTGKFLFSASLDRYVRVHHVDSTELFYQCYVKSKPTCLLIHEADNVNATININQKSNTMEDNEYDELFKNLQNIHERESGGEEDIAFHSHSKGTDYKRKSKDHTIVNQKKKKN